MRARPGESSWSLVIFTVLTQASVGLAIACAIGPMRHLHVAALILLVVGGLSAALHPGRVGRARYALSNLGSSWLSREGLLAGVFAANLVSGSIAWSVPAIGLAAALTGTLLVAAISRIYMIRTVPPWNTWLTPAVFFGTTLVLGAAVLGAILRLWITEDAPIAVLRFTAATAVLPTAFALAHFARFGRREQRAELVVRIALTLSGAIVALTGAGWAAPTALVLLASGELMGRRLFYGSHRRIGL